MKDKSYDPESLTALICDTHDLIRKSIGRTLKHLKFGKVLDAASGVSALNCLEQQRVDLIICDLDLGSMTATDLLSQIRSSELEADIPMVIVSGEAEKDEIIKALSLGADDYLLKPFNPEELEQKIERILRNYQNPEKYLGKIRQVEKLIKSEKLATAKVLLEDILSERPDSPRGRHLAALIQAKSGRHDDAIETLEDNISIFPAYLKNYVTLASLYQSRGDRRAAIAIMTQELWLNPKQTHRQITLGHMLLSEGKAKQAIEHFRNALLENPKNAAALLGMGRAYEKLPHPEKALYYFKRLRRQHPKETKALKAIVQLAERHHKEKLAEIFLRDEKKQYPDRPDTYVVLALMKEKQGDRELCISYLRECIKLCPNYGPSYYHLVRIQCHKEPQKAQHMFRSFYETNQTPAILTEEARFFSDHSLYTQALKTLNEIVQIKQSMITNDKTKSREDDADFDLLLTRSNFNSKQYAKAYLLALMKKQKHIAQKSKAEWLSRREERFLARCPKTGEKTSDQKVS